MPSSPIRSSRGTSAAPRSISWASSTVERLPPTRRGRNGRRSSAPPAVGTLISAITTASAFQKTRTVERQARAVGCGLRRWIAAYGGMLDSQRRCSSSPRPGVSRHPVDAQPRRPSGCGDRGRHRRIAPKAPCVSRCSGGAGTPSGRCPHRDARPKQPGPSPDRSPLRSFGVSMASCRQGVYRFDCTRYSR